MDIGGLSEGAAELAQELGFEVFKEEAELSEKFALGSSVGSTAVAGRLYIIVKSIGDIEGERAATFVEMLRRAWRGFSGQAPTSALIATEDEPA